MSCICDIESSLDAAGAARLYDMENKSGSKPKASGNFCGNGKIEPDRKTEEEAGQRQYDSGKAAMTGFGKAHAEGVPDHGSVDSHKGEKSTEVDQFGRTLVVENEGSEAGEYADEQDVSRGRSGARIEVREEDGKRSTA